VAYGQQEIEAASELQWVANQSAGNDGYYGFDASSWPDTTWVLHAMYELADLGAATSIDLDHTVTHHTPTNANITAVTETVGGFMTRPGPGWRRLRWGELASRSDGYLVAALPDQHPSGLWFNTAELPETLIAPPEGSLDEASLDSLTRAIGQHSECLGAQCYSYYAAITQNLIGPGRLFTGTLRTVPDLVRGDDAMLCTPSNIWPRDRSWFVWTDWHLWASRVSGPVELINALRLDPGLETFDQAFSITA
jgi:hypothetical protein